MKISLTDLYKHHYRPLEDDVEDLQTILDKYDFSKKEIEDIEDLASDIRFKIGYKHIPRSYVKETVIPILENSIESIKIKTKGHSRRAKKIIDNINHRILALDRYSKNLFPKMPELQKLSN